jgi:bleomycin hydrolase
MHHPYYTSFSIEVPDNFSNGNYYNLPLNEMMELINTSLKNGYSILWDTDVSNAGFKSKEGIALHQDGKGTLTSTSAYNNLELPWNENIRQHLFENLTTQDDHLMHIVGIEKNKDGKLFYNVKNSWGNVGPYHGFIKVSEAYMAINTISLVVPKAALSKAQIEKFKL